MSEATSRRPFPTGTGGYEGLLDDIGVGVVVVDLDGRVLEANRRARELIPMPEKSSGEVNVFDGVHEILDEWGRPFGLDELPVVRTLRTGVAETGVMMRFGLKEGAGPVRWLLVGTQVVRDESGDIARAICTFVDVTAQRAAQDALLASEERFRLLAENAADVIYRVRIDDGMVFQYVNPAVATVLGYQPAEFYADFDLALRLVHADDRASLEALFASTITHAATEIQPIVVRMVCFDGVVIWTEHRVVPIVDGGEVVAFEGILRDVSEQKAKEADYRHRALHDSLTGLANRAMLLERLEYATRRLRSEPAVLAVLYLDLDRFKTVNDNLGHAAGDKVLEVVARRIADAVRPSDSVARIGGDEFAAVLPDLRDESEGVHVAQRLLHAISAPISVAGGDLVTTASIGVTYAHAGRETPAELLRRADVAMYRAKDRGRSRVECYERAETEPGASAPQG